jgi:hypothetical protein
VAPAGRHPQLARYCPGTAGRSGQPEPGNQVLGIAGQGLEQVPALLSRG